jgi:hypothetical protein
VQTSFILLLWCKSPTISPWSRARAWEGKLSAVTPVLLSCSRAFIMDASMVPCESLRRARSFTCVKDSPMLTTDRVFLSCAYATALHTHVRELSSLLEILCYDVTCVSTGNLFRHLAHMTASPLPVVMISPAHRRRCLCKTLIRS